MVGSTQLLGNWDANNKGIWLKWSEGHIWHAQIEIGELEDYFEYKFIIKRGNSLDRWEEGRNHIYDFKKYIEMLKQPEVLKQIHESQYDLIEITTD